MRRWQVPVSHGCGPAGFVRAVVFSLVLGVTFLAHGIVTGCGQCGRVCLVLHRRCSLLDVEYRIPDVLQGVECLLVSFRPVFVAFEGSWFGLVSPCLIHVNGQGHGCHLEHRRDWFGGTLVVNVFVFFRPSDILVNGSRVSHFRASGFFHLDVLLGR